MIPLFKFCPFKMKISLLWKVRVHLSLFVRRLGITLAINLNYNDLVL